MNGRLLASVAVAFVLPWASPWAVVRRGNDAVRDGQPTQAIRAYAQAEGNVSDPGLVAFNKGTALYLAEQYGDAAAEFRRCLEDAQGLRQVRASYGQGNALAKEGGRRSGRAAIELLRQALKAYEHCLQSATERADSRSIADDARHNHVLVLALLKLKESEAPRDEPPSMAQQEAADSNESPGAGPRDPNASGKETGGKQSGKPDSRDGTPRATDQTEAGQGDLPPLDDDRDAAPISAGQAQAYLRKNLQRMQQERTRPKTPLPTHGDVRDW